MNQTPETEAVAEMETPVEITSEEMNDVRYSYDLPQNNDVKVANSESESVNTTEHVVKDDDVSDAPEQDNQSEIPGDPRESHQTQPPTAEQF